MAHANHQDQCLEESNEENVSPEAWEAKVEHEAMFRRLHRLNGPKRRFRSIEYRTG
jgi:hypothetical protein